MYTNHFHIELILTNHDVWQSNIESVGERYFVVVDDVQAMRFVIERNWLDHVENWDNNNHWTDMLVVVYAKENVSNRERIDWEDDVVCDDDVDVSSIWQRQVFVRLMMKKTKPNSLPVPSKKKQKK